MSSTVSPLNSDLKLPRNSDERLVSLEQLEKDKAAVLKKTQEILEETKRIQEQNASLAEENRILAAQTAACNFADVASMRLETRVLERNQNNNQRDFNILETQLKKLHKSCKLTDVEFNAMLVAIATFTKENDQLESILDSERSVMTPAAFQSAFEQLEKMMFEKLGLVQPEYVLHQSEN